MPTIVARWRAVRLAHAWQLDPCSGGSVIRKLLEAFFRHKLLLLAPPLLIPAIATPVAVVSTPPVYETGAGIWVDHPAYLNYNDGNNSWVSPVQSQAGRLNELLRTRAFQMEVAGRTSL